MHAYRVHTPKHGIARLLPASREISRIIREHDEIMIIPGGRAQGGRTIFSPIASNRYINAANQGLARWTASIRGSTEICDDLERKSRVPVS